MCLPHKKSQATFFEGSPAIYLRPVAFRPCFPAGLALSVLLKKLYAKKGSNVKLGGRKEHGDYSMVTALLKKLVVAMMVCNILVLGLAPVTEAGPISTQEAQQMTQREEQLTRINRIFLRSEVQEQMLAFGVEPKDVQDRLAVLSDEKLRQLAGRLQDMPAGGDSILAVVGLVFVVLIILELVGVTNILPNFNRDCMLQPPVTLPGS